MPHAFGRRAVNYRDLAKFASVGCAGIDDARAVLTQDAVVVVIQREPRKAIVRLHPRIPGALPVGRAAEQLAVAVVDLVDVVGRKMQIGLVEHYVVRCVFSILHRTENRVGAAAQHDVKRTKVHVTFVAEREQNQRARRRRALPAARQR